MTKKLNFIVTTINGYVIERIEICDYNRNKVNEMYDLLVTKEFNSKHIGEFNYIDDMAGNLNDLDIFLETGSNSKCEEEDYKKYSSNFLMEDWHTFVTGYIPDYIIGLEIK